MATQAIFLLTTAGIAPRATSTHGEPAVQPDHLPASHGVRPAAELTGQAPPTPAHTPQETQPTMTATAHGSLR
jgi:hypothetical protein